MNATPSFAIIALALAACVGLVALVVSVKLITLLFSGGRSHENAGPRRRRRFSCGSGGGVGVATAMGIAVLVAAGLFGGRSQIQRAHEFQREAMRERDAAHVALTSETRLATAEAAASRTPAIDLSLSLEDGTRINLSKPAPAPRQQQPAVAEAEPPPDILSQTKPQTDQLLSQLTSIIDTLERSPIPLQSVELLKQLRQFRSSLYGGATATASTTAAAPASTPGTVEAAAAPAAPAAAAPLAEAPTGPPAWARDEVTAPHRHVVMSHPHASRAAAWKDALRQATDIVTADYHNHMRGVGNWMPDLESLNQNAIALSYTEQLAWDFGAGTEFASSKDLTSNAYRTYLLVETTPPVRRAVYQQWREQVRGERLTAALLICGGLVLVVMTLAAYYRMDSGSGGWRRRLLQTTALLISIAALGVTAGEASRRLPQGTTNHVGPYAAERPVAPGGANEHASWFGLRPMSATHHRERVTIVEPPAEASPPEARFLTLPIQGRRVAFVVLGDRQLAGSGRAERISDEICRSVSGLKSGEFRVVCESSSGMTLANGKVVNHCISTSGGQPRNVRDAIKRCFLKDARATSPRNAMQLALQFNPDTLILICDADAAGLPATDVLRQELSHPPRLVHAVETGTQAEAEAQLSGLVSPGGGQYVFWKLSDGTPSLTE